MSRFRIAGAVLLVLLGGGLLIRVTNQPGVPPKKPASVRLEVRAVESQPVVTETVNLRNGNPPGPSFNESLCVIGGSQNRAAYGIGRRGDTTPPNGSCTATCRCCA